jgi:hypothetical protein
LITLLTKIQTLAVKQTRRSEQTEKWHGGGICAQRTGYIYYITHRVSSKKRCKNRCHDKVP